jgi:hypothetical protein
MLFLGAVNGDDHTLLLSKDNEAAAKLELQLSSKL